MEVKMVDICETMEGIVKIIKENAHQIRQDFDQRLEGVIQDIEIFETQINRSNSEMASQIKKIEEYNVKIVQALRNFHAQQIEKFGGLSECDEETEEVEEDDTDNQENMEPNREHENQFQSKALVNLLKSKGIKLQMPKRKNSKNKLVGENTVKKSAAKT
jgi:hypothetical protein